MKNFVRITALLAAVFGSIGTVVGGSEWKRITGDSSFTLYADAASIKISGQRRAVWVLFDYSLPQKNEDDKSQYRSQKNLWYIDCAGSTLGLKSYIQYTDSFGVGSIVATATVFEYMMVDSVPDSVGEGIQTFACAAKIKKLAKPY